MNTKSKLQLKSQVSDVKTPQQARQMIRDLLRPQFAAGLLKQVPIEQASNLYQFRFPKSKKKHIRNKWAKRIENFRPIPKSATPRFYSSHIVIEPGKEPK